MTKAQQRDLERILIVRTLANYGPCPSATVAEVASTECDHDALEGLPAISARGITSKLNALSLNGHVYAKLDPDDGRLLWAATARGLAWANTTLSRLS